MVDILLKNRFSQPGNRIQHVGERYGPFYFISEPRYIGAAKEHGVTIINTRRVAPNREIRQTPNHLFL